MEEWGHLSCPLGEPPLGLTEDMTFWFGHGAQILLNLGAMAPNYGHLATIVTFCIIAINKNSVFLVYK